MVSCKKQKNIIELVTRPGDNQLLGVAIFNVRGESSSTRHSPPANFQTLPLAPRSTLSWMGFTDEGVPCIADSAGFIRVLNKGFGSSWSQVCDTQAHAKSKYDHYFVIGVRSG